MMGKNGIYARTDVTDTIEDMENFIAACSDPSHPLEIIFLENYESDEEE